MLIPALNFMANHPTAVAATGGGKVTGVSGILRTIKYVQNFIAINPLVVVFLSKEFDRRTIIGDYGSREALKHLDLTMEQRGQTDRFRLQWLITFL